jgi:hypothetical protein
MGSPAGGHKNKQSQTAGHPNKHPEWHTGVRMQSVKSTSFTKFDTMLLQDTKCKAKTWST